jgi:hypothetical protein
MDLTNFNVDASSEGKSAVEPGRHVLHWQGEEEALVEGRNGWRGCKMYFEIDGSSIKLNHTFTVGHDNPKYVDSGVKSMLLMAQAMGLKEPPKDTSTAFMGKSVSAELVKDDNGYLKINEDWGKTWQPTDKKPEPVDDSIKTGPSESDLAAMGSTSVDDDDDAPF